MFEYAISIFEGVVKIIYVRKIYIWFKWCMSQRDYLQVKLIFDVVT